MAKIKLASLLIISTLICGCATPKIPYDRLVTFVGGNLTHSFSTQDIQNNGTWGAGETALTKSCIIYDGTTIYKATNAKTTPVAQPQKLANGWSIRFRPDSIYALPQDSTLKEAHSHVTSTYPAYATRITGTFREVIIEGENGQHFRVENIPGSIYTKHERGQNTTTSYFLSDNRTRGGKVIDIKTIEASIAIDICERDLTQNYGR